MKTNIVFAERISWHAVCVRLFTKGEDGTMRTAVRTVWKWKCYSTKWDTYNDKNTNGLGGCAWLVKCLIVKYIWSRSHYGGSIQFGRSETLTVSFASAGIGERIASHRTFIVAVSCHSVPCLPCRVFCPVVSCFHVVAHLGSTFRKCLEFGLIPKQLLQVQINFQNILRTLLAIIKCCVLCSA